MRQPLDREALLRLARQPDGAQFISCVTPRLCDPDDGDDELRLLLARRLAEAGLTARAAEVVDTLSPELRGTPAVCQMAQNLRNARPDGRCGWVEHAARFAANLAALRQRTDVAPGAVETLVRTWESVQDRFELHRSRDGGWQVWDREARAWRPSYGRRDPELSLPGVREKMRGAVLRPLVLEGIGLGEPLTWLHAVTADTLHGASTVIYVIEPSAAALAACLHLHDWTGLLAEERVRLFWGPQALADYEAGAVAETRTVPPEIVLRSRSWTDAEVPLAEANRRIAAAVEQRVRQTRARTEALYQERDPDWWAARYADALAGHGRPLRVLALTSRFTTVLQYSTRDVVAGFAAAGCQTRLLIEPSAWGRLTPAAKLAALEEFEPDLVFMIDHLRSGHLPGMIANVPMLTWVQDRLPWLFDPAAGRGLGPLDFCMGFSAAELTQRCGYPAERFFPCEMATDPAALGDPDTVDPDADRFACDLAYATHQSKSPDELCAEFRGQQPREAWPLIDALRDDLFARAARGQLNGNIDCESLLDRLAEACGLELSLANRTTLLDHLVRPLADRLLRFETIRWAADWASASGRRFHLYGKGWEGHPQFGRFARGALAHGRELGAAFRHARISLHAGCNPALHQRLLDGLAAGGFFLVRRHAGDSAWSVQQAILDFGQRRRLTPPFDVRPSDLPPPHDAAYRDLLVSNGNERGVGRVSEACWLGLQTRAAGERPYDAADFWPGFGQLTFGSAAELGALLERFGQDEPLRRATAGAMRDRVLERFTYAGLTRQVLHWLADRLARTAESRPRVLAGSACD